MSLDLPEEDIGTDEEINLNRVLEFSVYPTFEFTNEYVLEMDEEEQVLDGFTYFPANNTLLGASLYTNSLYVYSLSK